MGSTVNLVEKLITKIKKEENNHYTGTIILSSSLSSECKILFCCSDMHFVCYNTFGSHCIVI